MMRKFDAYLRQLQKALSTFSSSERDDILAEIQAHIEDGLQDPQMGASVQERGEKIDTELGSPTDLAERLYKAHWRKRWLAILLALIALAPLPIIFVVRVLDKPGHPPPPWSDPRISFPASKWVVISLINTPNFQSFQSCCQGIIRRSSH